MESNILGSSKRIRGMGRASSSGKTIESTRAAGTRASSMVRVSTSTSMGSSAAACGSKASVNVGSTITARSKIDYSQSRNRKNHREKTKEIEIIAKNIHQSFIILDSLPLNNHNHNIEN